MLSLISESPHHKDADSSDEEEHVNVDGKFDDIGFTFTDYDNPPEKIARKNIKLTDEEEQELLGLKQEISLNEKRKILGVLGNLEKLPSRKTNLFLKLPKNVMQLSDEDTRRLWIYTRTRKIPSLVINLNGTQFTSFPMEISFLSGIETLELVGPLEIPKEYGLLKNLKGLTVCENKLSNIPQELFALNGLEDLKLTMMKGDTYPSGLWAMKNLKALRLEVLDASDLTGIGDLKGLVELHISYVVKELPKDLDQLKALRILTLKNNQFEEFPKVILKMRLLSKLVIEEDSIDNLPDEIGNFKLLRHLEINNSNIKKVPRTIGSLEYLEFLQINCSPYLTSIPKEIGLLRGLKTLCLQYNTKLTSIPKEIGKIPYLSTLLVNRCNLNAIPKELTACRRLEILDISDNPYIITIPSEFDTLELMLQKFDYHRTGVKKLPDKLGQKFQSSGWAYQPRNKAPPPQIRLEFSDSSDSDSGSTTEDEMESVDGRLSNLKV